MPKDPRPVIQTDLDGKIIQRFSSASQAAKTLLVKETLIRASLYDKKKKVMGKWRFVFTEKEQAPPPTADSLGLTDMAQMENKYGAIPAPGSPALPPTENEITFFKGLMDPKQPQESELAALVDFKPAEAEAYDSEKLDHLTIDEPAMFAQPEQDRREVFADLSQNPDRWLTPYERVIKRRHDSNE